MPVSSTGGQVPDSGMIELWASDFDAGSYHPCGYPVILSFSPDINQTNRTFTCIKTDVDGNLILDANGNQQSGIGTQEVDIYVTTMTPDGGMVQTFCSTFIDIQDNHATSPCVQNTVVTVTGRIETELENVIEDVDVQLEGSPFSTNTDVSGNYAFPSMAPGGNYVINPFSDEDPLAGISTIDLLMIQRHILGIETLDSPYKIIAADINNNSTIDGTDLVELRKLILGIYTELPQNDSWRFVDKAYEFTPSQNPLDQNFVEDYEIIGLNQNMGVNFVAIKVGDVDESIDQYLTDRENNSQNASKAGIAIGALAQGDGDENLMTIPITISNESPIRGFQMELDYDSSLFEVVEINGRNIDVAESNYNLTGNSVLLSWNSEDEFNAIEFEILVKEKVSVNNNQTLFTLSSDILKSEVYNSELAVQGLEIENANIQQKTLLLENNPNPFNSHTEIRFYLGQRSTVDFLITDIQGRVVKSFESEFDAGQNGYTVRKNDLVNTGIYYVTLKTTGYTETIKIVLID